MPDCYKSAPLVTKVPYNVTKVPCCRYESALVTLQKCPWLQKFPTLVTKVPYPVTKVPFFRYKSARSYGSLSLSLSLSLYQFGRKQLPSNKAACKQNRHKHRHGDLGCVPFTKRFREIRLERKWNTTFWVVQQKIYGNNERSEKVVLFFPDGIF